MKVNRGGPEKLEGIVNSVGNGFFTIISNEEVIRVSLFHVKNISYGAKIAKTKGEKDSDEANSSGKSNTNNRREITLVRNSSKAN